MHYNCETITQHPRPIDYVSVDLPPAMWPVTITIQPVTIVTITIRPVTITAQLLSCGCLVPYHQWGVGCVCVYVSCRINWHKPISYQVYARLKLWRHYHQSIKTCVFMWGITHLLCNIDCSQSIFYFVPLLAWLRHNSIVITVIIFQIGLLLPNCHL